MTGLPEGFAFLSGLPYPARKRRIIVPIQAFVDESGGGKHFVMAGLIADSESWIEFSDEWRVCLDQPPAIKVFKMRDAAGLSGAFYKWTKEDRDNRLRQLARIINRYAVITTHSVIDLDAFEEVWKKQRWSPQNDVYFWPFHNTIMAACFALWDRGIREKFEIIFDENVIFGPRARVWYPVIREGMRIREPEAFTIMPVDPLFRSDDEFLPIQAADLFAWCIRRATDQGGDAGFEWLLDEMKDVQVTEYSQYYDRERMEAVSADALRQLREGLIPPEYHKLYVEIRRRIFGDKT
jgi:hypothetical protein